MQERDQFSLRSDPRLIVDHRYSGGSAAVERGFEIVDLEADVMDRGTAARHELPNWRIVVNSFEQLDERPASIQAADPRSVHRGKLSGLHSEDIPVKGKRIGDRADRNANVGNSDALGG